jgi:hypothetical protein
MSDLATFVREVLGLNVRIPVYLAHARISPSPRLTRRARRAHLQPVRHAPVTIIFDEVGDFDR